MVWANWWDGGRLEHLVGFVAIDKERLRSPGLRCFVWKARSAAAAAALDAEVGASWWDGGRLEQLVRFVADPLRTDATRQVLAHSLHLGCNERLPCARRRPQ